MNKFIMSYHVMVGVEFLEAAKDYWREKRCLDMFGCPSGFHTLITYAESTTCNIFLAQDSAVM